MFPWYPPPSFQVAFAQFNLNLNLIAGIIINGLLKIMICSQLLNCTQFYNKMPKISLKSTLFRSIRDYNGQAGLV